uniref:spore coat associated protein CotJA n=1 Tax=Clostridium sp. 12(A) TaxID=1163671 RepID=UPI00336AE9EE
MPARCPEKPSCVKPAKCPEKPSCVMPAKCPEPSFTSPATSPCWSPAPNVCPGWCPPPAAEAATECIDQYPVGMAYVPWQNWQQVYSVETAINMGTIFPDLFKPFTMGGCR